MVHLAFLLLLRNSWWWRNVTVARSRLPGADVALGRARHLQELDAADHDQQCWPSPVEVDVKKAVKQEKYAQREQHRRTHEAACLAPHATAGGALADLHDAHHAEV